MKNKSITKKIDFKLVLGIISIISFGGILASTVFETDLTRYADGMLYIIMGIALTVAGSIRMFFKFFNNGITVAELSKMLTDLIGLASVLTGLSIILDLQNPLLLSFRAIIALLAIIIIAGDIYNKKW